MHLVRWVFTQGSIKEHWLFDVLHILLPHGWFLRLWDGFLLHCVRGAPTGSYKLFWKIGVIEAIRKRDFSIVNIVNLQTHMCSHTIARTRGVALYLMILLVPYMSPVKRICVFEHSIMTNFNCACPAIQRGQGSGFLSEGSSWLATCMSEQRRFWRDCADAQARLNLRCSHRR